MFMARFLHRSIAAPLRQAFLEDFVMADYDAALGTMLEAVSEKAAIEMPQEYASLKVPVLLISGEYDRIITAEMGKRAAVLNPLITYRVIPETGHFPMLEDAPTYLNHVQQFLQLAPV
jgi:pimeloyl-ACP methyl ester carboxylesterase